MITLARLTVIAALITFWSIRPAPGQTFMIFPPAEYDRYYEGDLTIKMVATIEELYAICQINKPQLLACTLRNQHSCVIVLVNDEVMRKRSWTTGLLLRHYGPLQRMAWRSSW